MRPRTRSGIGAALLASSIAACNALTGVSDLTPCSDCGDGTGLLPDGALVDGPIGKGGKISPDGSDPDSAVADGAVVDTGGNDGNVDASDAGLIGCQGAVDCARVVFVSSMAYTGNLGGIAGADSKCQALADTSPNPRIKGHTFQAWVSTASMPVSARFTHGSQPYILGDATVIASDWADLTDGNLAHGIDRDERNQPHGGDDAWTATTSNGANYAGASCEDWTNGTAASGTYGNVGGGGSGWSSSGPDPCPVPDDLYCFEK